MLVVFSIAKFLSLGLFKHVKIMNWKYLRGYLLGRLIIIIRRQSII